MTDRKLWLEHHPDPGSKGWAWELWEQPPGEITRRVPGSAVFPTESAARTALSALEGEVLPQ